MITNDKHKHWKNQNIDNESIFDTSVISPEEEGNKYPSASPISSVPNIVEAVSDAAWRSTTLPVLNIGPELMVWEVSERCTAWIVACHIKLGVAGAESQFF